MSYYILYIQSRLKGGKHFKYICTQNKTNACTHAHAQNVDHIEETGVSVVFVGSVCQISVIIAPPSWF